MHMCSTSRSFVCLLVFLGIPPVASAQWAVVDVRAIAQLTRQMAIMREQLTTARNQLTQAQQEFQSITGERGMDRLIICDYLAGMTDEYATRMYERLFVPRHGMFSDQL